MKKGFIFIPSDRGHLNQTSFFARSPPFFLKIVGKPHRSKYHQEENPFFIISQCKKGSLFQDTTSFFSLFAKNIMSDLPSLCLFLKIVRFCKKFLFWKVGGPWAKYGTEKCINNRYTTWSKHIWILGYRARMSSYVYHKRAIVWRTVL